MFSTIQVRVDDDLKMKSDGLFKGFPFQIKRASVNPYESSSEVDLLGKLEKSRESASLGMYREAIEVSRDMREKYGL